VKRWLIVLALITGYAQAATPTKEDEVRKAFQARYPGISVESVARTPLPGIFEIFANGTLLYADEKVEHLIADGRLVDAQTRTDLTAQRLRKLQAIAFDSLPLNSAFKLVRGNGKRQMAYFADPNCAYCKKFERELLKVSDVTIHVFLYAILSADSVEKARAVWCSKDRAKVWTDWMLKGVKPAAGADCETPVEQVLLFGRRKGISGTPTLIFADGSRVPGMIPASDLNKLLDAASN
jgi:thiol:disulfide interchange protein DsbC